MDAVKAAFPLKGEKQTKRWFETIQILPFTGDFRCISPAVWSYLPILWLWFFSALLYFAASGARIQREEEQPLSGQRVTQRGRRAEQPPLSRGRRCFVFCSALRAAWMQKKKQQRNNLYLSPPPTYILHETEYVLHLMLFWFNLERSNFNPRIFMNSWASSSVLECACVIFFKWLQLTGGGIWDSLDWS